MQADVTQWDSLSAAFSSVYKSAGRIDLVFANAGVIEKDRFWETSFLQDNHVPEPDMLTVDVTLKGALFSK